MFEPHHHDVFLSRNEPPHPKDGAKATIPGVFGTSKKESNLVRGIGAISQGAKAFDHIISGAVVTLALGADRVAKVVAPTTIPIETGLVRGSKIGIEDGNLPSG